ncbi:DNA gyrase subunit A [Candidatus Shapirobacteria bacterium CG08_land_8_20_14_0_20_39_18]|uniref:DNA gyrase subunit A n=1 Tax=Candidatus Shapirobacteria bacterium CG08_land_8_20_14_0_20_39_18 TaxID=1974883 RepID=A0A2M6XEB7_9BACT|nr:MAG: DNA gyrase subunit A [Candidatus Shapirobacteria bacterium CG08_land_8_20_14_0_20_39_18]PIY66103.1 MAG: DNA gyrase subunit A [Candidatus Shapirobacteria bacterium CG_4_10_14_0_8_um_filter_39_15]PJE68658.1 MAG: DNA gyrase subunit A [Candidatus Shapirobacteria bacterium CG10_big_fil_rev_8_21_14_0_10_38_8]
MDFGKIIPAEISTEMKKSFLDYAMSVIVARALPDVRDGLKPVHRRILYAMDQMGLTHTAHYSKSAKIVGEVLGKYHPHGDMSVYDTLVRLAQDFSMRYLLIDGQGNFGSVDGDMPAAMRYTEARLSAIASELLIDIEKETVPFIDNFDATLKEPVYLPAKLPNLLLMGSDGIAVGMATKIPTHNLSEVVDAVCAMIEKPVASDPQHPFRFDSEITVEELLKYLKGPDFPTGGEIFDAEAIKEVYATGRGRIVIRGKAEIEETKAGKFQVIITEIPFQVNKADMVKRIAELVKDKKLDGISDLRDESDRHGIRVVVELKRDARPKAVLNNLYKLTNLQTVFPANFVALVDGTPQTLNLKQILTYFLRHRHEIVTKRSEYELKEARARAHILEGLIIALDHLDAVIKTIRESEDAEEAKKNLMVRFDLSEIQAVAILDMQLRKLAHLERQKIEDEYKMIQETIAYLEDLLADPGKILEVVKTELIHLKEKYHDERKTRVYPQKLGEFSEEDLIPKEETLITITQTGYIKRVARNTFRSQRRGGKGVMGMTTKEEDEIDKILSANTHDNILFFTDKGRVFQLRVWDLPEASRQAKGQAIINLINIETGEQIQSILTTSNEEREKQKFLLLVTNKGTVKKTSLENYKNIRLSGLIAIKLVPNDSLCWAHVTSGDDQVLLISHEGKSIKFSENDIRSTARDTMGVRGVLLKPDDYVVGMEVFPSQFTVPTDKRRKFFKDILVIMEKGIGKRTDLSEFPLQKRGGMGVKVAEVTPKTGKISCARMVDENIEQVIMTSRSAQVIKLPLKNIPQLGRATQGVILMRFSDSTDTVAGVTCLEKEEETEE